MNRMSRTFKPASFDAEEFADEPLDPTDRGSPATLITYEAFDLVCCESPDSQVAGGINAGVTAEYARDLAAMNERIAGLAVPPRSSRRLGDKPTEASRPEAAR